MAKLTGKAVSDQIVEYYGPITGRNYNTAGAAAPAAAAINIQVTGTGSIQLQETQTFKIRGNAGLNNFTNDKVPDETTWVNLGPVIDAAAGLTTVSPAVDPSFSCIRAIVAVSGEGRVIIQSDWR